MKPFFQKLIKLIVVSFIVLAIGIVGFFGYLKLDSSGFLMTKEEKYFYRKLGEFKETGNKSIALKELTNFQWDKVVFIPPYGWFNSTYSDKFTLDKKISNSDDGQAVFLFLNTNMKRGYVIDSNPYEYGSDSNDFFNFSNAQLLIEEDKVVLTKKILEEKEVDDKYKIEFSKNLNKFLPERRMIYSQNKEEFNLIKDQKKSLDIFIGMHDINNDKKNDLFVYYNSSFYCGSSGCLTEVFLNVNDVWNKVLSKHTYGDIILIHRKNSKYKDINILGEGKHIANNNMFKWNSNTKQYQLN